MSQRISRGFHRLAIFLAAIPFLIGGTWATFVAIAQANSAQGTYEETVKLVCAQTELKKNPPRLLTDEEVGFPPQPGQQSNQKLRIRKCQPFKSF